MLKPLSVFNHVDQTNTIMGYIDPTKIRAITIHGQRQCVVWVTEGMAVFNIVMNAPVEAIYKAWQDMLKEASDSKIDLAPSAN